MVKPLFIAATALIYAASSYVMAQEQDQTSVSTKTSDSQPSFAFPTAFPSGFPTALPSGFTFPPGALPTEALAALSSLLNNPVSMQSYISMASVEIGHLPTQFQADAYSAIAAASKSFDAMHPQSSISSANNSSDAVQSGPSFRLTTGLLISAAVGFGVFM